MAIAFQTFASGNNTADGNTVTVDKPTGVATGDVLVAVVGFWHGAATAGTITESAPSGWVLVGKYPAAGNEAMGLAVWRKTITDGGSEPSTYDFGMDSSQAPDGSIAATIARFSGVDNTTPVDVTGTNNYTSSSLTVTFNGVTTTTANTMLVMCGANRRTLTYTFNNGTEIDDQSGGDSGDPSNTVSIGMGYLAQAAAGASGNKTATISGATPRENVGFMFALKEASPSGLSITSVDTDNAVLAGQSQATFAGTGLASTAKFAVKRGSAIAYGADISLSGSTGGSFTAPTMTAMFSAGVRFGDVAFYAAETSGTAIASISGSITTATNWKYVNVTDLSATGSMGSLFYGNAVSLSDQVAYSSVTTRFRWPVTVSGDGYFTVNSSGSQAGDEFAYRIWDETDSTWGTEGTIEVNGGISSAEQVYAAGSLVQASLESSTLEGATLQ